MGRPKRIAKGNLVYGPLPEIMRGLIVKSLTFILMFACLMCFCVGCDKKEAPDNNMKDSWVKSEPNYVAVIPPVLLIYGAKRQIKRKYLQMSRIL